MPLIETEIIDLNSNLIEILYLNNPETKNSMTWEMGEAFYDRINAIKNQTNKPSCLIITGKNNIFSGGGDLKLLKSFATKSYEQNCKDMMKFYNFFLSIRELPFPVVGAINGHAIGAALALAFACDIRIFADNGKYSFNFVKIGIHPGMGSSYIVKELFGTEMAKTMLMLADTINGKQAQTMGLCQDSVQGDDVLKRSIEFAMSMSESSPLALRLLKQNLYNWDGLQAALKKEAESQAKNFQTLDFIEAINSIEQKRKPVYKDR